MLRTTTLGIDRRSLALLFILLALFAALAALGYTAILKLQDNTEHSYQAHRVQSARHALLTALLDMETGQRGYLITHSETYLAPYRRAAPLVDAAYDELRRAVSEQHGDDAVAAADMAELGQQVKAKREHSARVVALAATSPAQAAALVQEGAGMAAMNKVRAALDRMAAREADALALHQRLTIDSVRQNVRVGSAVLFVVAVLLLVVYALMRRETLARERVAQLEQQAYARLESRVQERTRALQATEVQLQVSAAELRAVFDSTSEAIIIVNEEQRVVMANPAAARTFGYAIEQLAGSNLDMLLPARFREAHRHHMKSFADTANHARPMGRRREIAALRADGREFPIEAAISHLRIDGQSLSTVVLRDVTERQQSEKALRESESRLRTLLGLLPEAVFVNTADRITYVNKAARELFGGREDELLGLAPLQLIAPESRAQVLERIRALLAGAATMPLAELNIVRRDGSLRAVETTATTIDDHGQRSIVVVLRDVSELHQARAALARSHAELQRLLQAQSEVQEDERKRIARELHDDLQQTLAAIKMDLAAAGALAPKAGKAGTGAPGSLASLMADAHALADTALLSTRRIINDLRPQILDDLGLLPALQAMASQFSQRTGIDCEVLCDELEGLCETLSPQAGTALFRITQEALNNVFKHSQARHVEVEITLKSGLLVLTVQDDGRGITDEDRSKIGSSGLLGMRERARALGGTLSVTRLPAGGTRVEVVAPLAAAGVAPA
ncbi:MAG: PAS domain S-box protein [Rhizobacter sp.]|nr:PAS domain S-box protein [Rhizobacter sp.]